MFAYTTQFSIMFAMCRALRIIDDTAETHVGDSGELQLLVDARVKCYNNLAAAQMKVRISLTHTEVYVWFMQGQESDILHKLLFSFISPDGSQHVETV